MNNKYCHFLPLKRIASLLPFLFFGLFPYLSSAQINSSQSIPTITNYTSKEYSGSAQIWSIDQDHRGFMYFGTSTGIVKYDGNTWETLISPVKSLNTTTRALLNDGKGNFYYGSLEDFGYLKEDEYGNIKQISLIGLIPEEHRVFNEIWTIHELNGKIYFQARGSIFIYSPEEGGKKPFIEVWKPDTEFMYAFQLDDTYYVHQIDLGLFKLVDGKLGLIPGSEFLGKDRTQVMFNPGTNGQFVIGSFRDGLHHFNGKSFTPFKTEADVFLFDSRLYKGTVLPDKSIVLADAANGILIIDDKGKLLTRMNTSKELIDDGVYSLFVDRGGTLWAGTNNGISKIEISSPLSRLVSPDRQLGNILSLNVFEDNLFIGGSQKLLFLDKKDGMIKQVMDVPSAQIFNITLDGDQLLISNQGIYSYKNGKSSKIPVAENLQIIQILISESHPGYVFISGAFGIAVLKRERSAISPSDEYKWDFIGQLPQIERNIYSLAEDNDGELWGGTQAGEFFRITWAKTASNNIDILNSKVRSFTEADGLPGTSGRVTKVQNRIYLSAIDGFYYFDKKEERFIKDAVFSFSNEVADVNFDSFTLLKDNLDQVIIFFKNERKLAVPGTGGTYSVQDYPINLFTGEGLSTFYSEPNGIFWLATDEGLIRIDGEKLNTTDQPFPVYFTKIISSSDTLSHKVQTDEIALPEIEFKSNSIRFTYAAPFFIQEKLTKYQTFLEGFDSDWGKWEETSFREFTNLPYGTYTFRVKAKNIYNTISDEISYSFVILPPWYATWWAYLMYVLLSGMVVGSIVISQRNRAISKERQLSALREVTLKAEAENERRKNIELIGEIGKEITRSLSIENIIDTVYNHVNKLMDSSVFGIGIYNKPNNRLEFPATKEKGSVLPAYSYSVEDNTRPASWCFRNQKEIFSNDFENDHHNYVEFVPPTIQGDATQSIVYLPLFNKEKIIGVLTAQSFSKNAYSDFHLDFLRSIATYAALALDNAEAYRDLKHTQAQLIQSEKMASLGELTAGIAHEIQNPLNFVNNFSELSVELADELKEELSKIQIDPGQKVELESIADDIIQNQQKINHHGKRAESIVKGMLQHSRTGSGKKELSDLNGLADEYLRLSYHGLRAKDKSFQSDFKADLDPHLPRVEVMPQDMGRVLLNLINNAFYAVNEKRKKLLEIGDTSYKPMVKVKTQSLGNAIEISVMDNGEGIPESVKSKIFQPFFTTKPTGQGTGLGLSLSYDIVKAHGGDLELDSIPGESTQFKIILPLN
jgi:signal transduction histidine kinase/ligand-binding sensor domain-containing protein